MEKYIGQQPKLDIMSVVSCLRAAYLMDMHLAGSLLGERHYEIMPFASIYRNNQVFAADPDLSNFERKGVSHTSVSMAAISACQSRLDILGGCSEKHDPGGDGFTLPGEYVAKALTIARELQDTRPR